MQQRAPGKYHSAGLWTNTCCSHPRPGETLDDAARRRLYEEMGLEAELQHRFHFIYQASFQNGLHEHELDHVFFGVTDRDPRPDPLEVVDFKWMEVEELNDGLVAHPEKFTAWLHDCWPRVIMEIEKDRR